MDGGAWWAAVHGVAESWTRLSTQTTTKQTMQDVLKPEEEVLNHWCRDELEGR